MLPVSGNVNAQPRKLSCKLVIGSNTITDVKLLTYSSDWSGNITVGQVVSSYISVTVPTPSFSLAGANVSLSMGIGDPVEWVLIGNFHISEESIRTRQGYTSFKAFDKLYSTINTYHTALSYPTTLQAIFNEVCTQIGVNSFNILNTFGIVRTFQADSEVLEDLDGYTLRDVLGFIGGYCGRNVYLAPNGADLQFRWFTSTSYDADNYKANVPYIGENDCTVSRLICQTQDGVITSGSGEGIYFTCPFMDQTRLNAMLSGLSLTYRKADVDIPYGNFCLQSGDIITVSTTGQNLTVPIMNNSFTYDGGVSSAVSAYGVSDYSGTANNAERSLSVRRVQRKMAVNRAHSELETATKVITGASGGYIKINFGGDGKTAALLIMDTNDISTAQNVWVFNQNGLGHFPNGYDVGNVNLALTMDGTVVAERIAGEMISGVGIENVAPGTISRPKIVLADGAIYFQRVAADPDGSISDIGSIKYVPRSAFDEIDALSIHAEQGKTVTIGYESSGDGHDDFVYYSDLSAPNVPSDAAKFNFWGDLRIFSDSHWISMTDLDKRIEQQRIAIFDDYGGIARKNIVKENTVNFTGYNKYIECLPLSGVIALYIGNCVSNDTDASTCSLLIQYTDGTTSSLISINRNTSTLVQNLDIGTKTIQGITVYSSNTYVHSSGDTATYTDIMICSQAIYDADSNYQPYIMSNAEITAWIQSQS